MLLIIVLLASVCYLVGYVLESIGGQFFDDSLPLFLFIPAFIIGLLLRICLCVLLLILIGGITGS